MTTDEKLYIESLEKRIKELEEINLWHDEFRKSEARRWSEARAVSNEQVHREYNLEPGQLQVRWRDNPPDTFDHWQAESAVVEALCQEGIIAWHGDGTSIVTQIIQAVYKKVEQRDARIAELEKEIKDLKPENVLRCRKCGSVTHWSEKDLVLRQAVTYLGDLGKMPCIKCHVCGDYIVATSGGL